MSYLRALIKYKNIKYIIKKIKREQQLPMGTICAPVTKLSSSPFKTLCLHIYVEYIFFPLFHLLFPLLIVFVSINLIVTTVYIYNVYIFPHKNDVRFVFTSSCLQEGSCHYLQLFVEGLMSLPPVVCRRAHVLITLFVFVCACGVQHILQCCIFVLLLHLVYPMSLTFIY